MKTSFAIESENVRISIHQDSLESAITMMVVDKKNEPVEGKSLGISLLFKTTDEWACFRNLVNQFFVDTIIPTGETAFSQGSGTGAARTHQPFIPDQIPVPARAMEGITGTEDGEVDRPGEEEVI